LAAAGVVPVFPRSSKVLPALVDILISPVEVTSTLTLSSSLSSLALKVVLIRLTVAGSRPMAVMLLARASRKPFSTSATLAVVILALSVAILATRSSGLPVPLIRAAMAWVMGVMLTVELSEVGWTLTSFSSALPTVPVTVTTNGEVNLLGSKLSV
jgi:hypothetical protein